MNYSSFQFFLSEVYSSVTRNRLMAFATFTTMSFSILILGIFFLMIGNLNFITNFLISQVEVKVFLEDNLSDKAVYEVKNALSSHSMVEKVHFVSKEEALEMLEKKLRGNIPIKKNPLLDSIEVSVKDPENISEVALFAQELSGVHHVKYGRLELESLIKFSRIIQVLGGVIIVALILITVLIVSNTIRLTIYARRKEIEIMQLVGATRWFVRWPFIMEGLFYGFFGSFLSSAALFIIYYVFAAFFVETIYFIEIIPGFSSFTVLLALGLIITGMIMGFFSSFLSVTRFLKN